MANIILRPPLRPKIIGGRPMGIKLLISLNPRMDLLFRPSEIQ
jgi:hypothetical protein